MSKITKNYRIFGLLAAIFWASSYSCTKIALSSLHPFALGSIRYVIAAILLCAIGAFKRIGLPAKKDVGWFFLAGFVGFSVYMLAYNYGASLNTASVTSSVACISPITTAVLASIFFKEKQTFWCWVMIIVEFAGIIVLNFTSGFKISIGVLMIVLGALLFSCYNLLLRRFAGKYTSFQVTTYSITTGAIFLLPLMPWAVPQLVAAPLSAIGSTLFIAVFPSALAYMVWSRAMALAPSSGAATNYLFMTPIFGMLFNYIIVGDVPTTLTVVGLVIVLTGLFLYNYFSHHPELGMPHLRHHRHSPAH